MACTTTETACDSLRRRYTEASSALHLLLMGQVVVQVADGAGHMVQYSKPDVATLRAYVAELRAGVNVCNGGCGGPRRFFQAVPLG